MFVKTIGSFKEYLIKHKIRKILVDLDNTLVNTYLAYKLHLEQFNFDFSPELDYKALEHSKEEIKQLLLYSNYQPNQKLLTFLNNTRVDYIIYSNRPSEFRDIFTKEVTKIYCEKQPQDIVYFDGNREEFLSTYGSNILIFDDKHINIKSIQNESIRQIFIMQPWNRDLVNENDYDFIFAY